MSHDRHRRRRHRGAGSLGAALAQLGERDDALRSLRQAVDGGYSCYPWFAADPRADHRSSSIE